MGVTDWRAESVASRRHIIFSLPEFLFVNGCCLTPRFSMHFRDRQHLSFVLHMSLQYFDTQEREGKTTRKYLRFEHRTITQENISLQTLLLLLLACLLLFHVSVVVPDTAICSPII